jgi:cytochrome bd-type quinol oxidase subunit 2
MTYTADLQPRNFYSLGLLFLVALPWLAIAPAIPVLLAVVLAWGSRQVRGLRQYAMFSSVYAALTVFLLPPFDLRLALFSRFEPFFVVLLFGYGLGMALDGVQDGTVWAWLAPLLLFLAVPSAWGAAAVLGLALVSALEKQRSTTGNRDYWLEKKHLVNLGLVVVVAAAVGLLLPRVSNFQDPTNAVVLTPSVVVAEPPKEPENSASPATASLEKRPAPMRDTGDGLLSNATALLYILVVVLGIFLFRSKLEKRKANPNNSLWDFVPILAALILATVILVFALSAPPNIPDGKAFSTDSPLTPTTTPKDMVPLAPSEQEMPKDASGGASGWFPFVMGGLALLLLYWLLRRTSQQFVLAPDPEPDLPNPVPTQAASNRVRQAYLAFLELATRQGLPRMAAETPLEFVERYGQQFVQSRAAAETLTMLYEPVRYGQLAAETHALDAENALATIQQPRI